MALASQPRRIQKLCDYLQLKSIVIRHDNSEKNACFMLITSNGRSQVHHYCHVLILKRQTANLLVAYLKPAFNSKKEESGKDQLDSKS